MPRTARIAPGGMLFHVLNRGVARMQILEKAGDYQAFERVLEETLQEAPMRVCAYCVLPNRMTETDRQASWTRIGVSSARAAKDRAPRREGIRLIRANGCLPIFAKSDLSRFLPVFSPGGRDIVRKIVDDGSALLAR